MSEQPWENPMWDTNGSEQEVPVEKIADTRLHELKKQIESHNPPIREKIPELETRIEEAMDRSGVFLLLGQTGSGKSIYSPLAIRNVLKKRGLPDKIVILQPRKDAAKGVAEAHAAVTDGVLGKDVGYSTSEARVVERDTPVRVVTSGILPRYLFDKTLTTENTGAIILDEVHEGSIDYHFVFGLIKELRTEGRSPFVFLTSATVQKEKFQKFFGFDNQDFMQIEGRTYPVEKEYLRHRTVEEGMYDEEFDPRNYLKDTIETVKKAVESEREGDILVFLPGVAEINEAVEEIAKFPEVEVLPLYGGLNFEQRNRALSGEKKRGAKRKVIIATNVAETSVTVPNITIVVDSCRRNSRIFDAKAGIYRKVTELISIAEADQRTGRAGRVKEGVCYRILSKEQEEELLLEPKTEIERASLGHLILRLRGYGYDPETFPFFVQPKKEDLHAGVEQLRILGALGTEGNITQIGTRMLHLPFRPEDSRMIVEAEDRNCKEAAVLLALFAREQKIFTFPTQEEIDRADGWTSAEKKLNARRAIAESQAHFEYGRSDWHKRINIFIEAVNQGGVFDCLGDKNRPEVKKANKHFREWCKMYHLNPEALKHIAYRLYEFSRAAGMPFDQYEFLEALYRTDAEEVGKAILAGYQEKLLYQVGQGKMADYIHLQKASSELINLSPESSAFSFSPDFCVASSINEGTGTMYGKKITRNYAAMVHPVSFEDVFELIGHKFESESVGKPYYNSETERVEQTIVYKMPEKGESFGERSMPVDGEQSVRVFAEAIMEGKVGLLVHSENLKTLNTIESLAIRSQGKVSVPDLHEWYVKRLGKVCSLEEAERMGRFLLLNVNEIISKQELEEINKNYPEFLLIDGNKHPIQYEYGRGNPAYGIPSYFRATVGFSLQELDRFLPDIHFEVGPEGERIPVQLSVDIPVESGERRTLGGYTVKELKAELGGGQDVSISVLSENRQVQMRLEGMIYDMRLKESRSKDYGFEREEFRELIQNLELCLANLKENTLSEKQMKENMEVARAVAQGITRQLKDKQEYLVRESERRRQEFYELYEQVEGRMRGTIESQLAKTPHTRDSLLRRLREVYSAAYYRIDEAEKGMQELLKEVGELEKGSSKGSLQAAFEQAGSKKEKKKFKEEKKVEEKKTNKDHGLETEMTTEIREEIGGEIEFLEAILDDVFVQAREVIDTSISNTKSKRVEAAERILKRQALKRDLKDLRKEVDGDEKPSVVRGHLGRVRDSIVSLLKANMHQIIPGYEKEWTERFRELWDDAEKAVGESKEANEYIEAGLVDKSRVVRDVRDLLRAHSLSLQIGNEIRVSFEKLIEQALGKY